MVTLRSHHDLCTQFMQDRARSMRHLPLFAAAAWALVGVTPARAQDVILKCPIAQSAARNGDKPDPQLLRQLVRCRKGEKPAEPGFDGAVTIEVSALAVGSPRDWDGRRDSGTGERGTKVYPVKVTYTERTHYKTRTVVAEDWMRVMNFYVDAFGEWRSGSEEPIKPPTNKSIAK